MSTRRRSRATSTTCSPRPASAIGRKPSPTPTGTASRATAERRDRTALHPGDREILVDLDGDVARRVEVGMVVQQLLDRIGRVGLEDREPADRLLGCAGALPERRHLTE